MSPNTYLHMLACQMCAGVSQPVATRLGTRHTIRRDPSCDPSRETSRAYRTPGHRRALTDGTHTVRVTARTTGVVPYSC